MSAYNTTVSTKLNGVENHDLENSNNNLDHDAASSADCILCSDAHRHTNEVYNTHSKPPLPTSKTSLKIDEGTSDDIDNNLKKIEQMWDKFNLNDYNQNAKKYSELKVFEEKAYPKVTFEEDWAHKTTVPKPFSLTIREEQKAGKKSKRQIKLEEELREKQEAELKECNKQFKARPLPAHVTKPLFEEKKQEEELRKLRLRLESKEYLESVQKPFSITERQRRHSFSGQTEHEDNLINQFVANPLPEFYFDNEYLSERFV